jgi:four helix bundle protein
LKRLRGERVKMLNLSNLTGYKKLILYQKAKDLVLTIYRLTEGFPKTEIYTLVPQMRRAAISIMANIVEGYSKGTSAEYARFLTISIGSLTELEVYLDLCLDLEYITQTEFEKSFNLLIEVKKLLYVSRKTIRERIK